MAKNDEQPTPSQILTVIESVKATLETVAEQGASNSQALTEVKQELKQHSKMLSEQSFKLEKLDKIETSGPALSSA